MKYCFIMNPVAGKGNEMLQKRDEILSTCQRLGVDYSILLSDSIEKTEQFIKATTTELESGEKVAFISCGGDGTLCKTVSIVMSLPEAQRQMVCLGVMPLGTGNDFVSNFANKEKFLSVESQINSECHRVDMIKCNDAYSVNMINIGFDCHVVCKKEELGKKRLIPKSMAYIYSLVLTLIKKPGVLLRVSYDGGETTERRLLLTTMANGGFCGGGFNSNPNARIDDGSIDCLVVNNVSRTRFLSIVGSYKKGTHLSGKYKRVLDSYKCRKADMYFDSRTPVSIDGEIIRVNELHISILEKAVNFMIPKGAFVSMASQAEQTNYEMVSV